MKKTEISVNNVIFWRPICEYDAMKIKPKNCIFYFKEYKSGKMLLKPMLDINRTFGNRECLAFIELPECNIK